MTQTVNGARPVTLGADVRMRVRASENPVEASDRPDPTQGSAYTRAIPQEPDIRPAGRPSKIGNFASTHVGDAKAAAKASWFGRERLPAYFDVVRGIAPANGEAGNWIVWTGLFAAGLLRAALLSLCYLAAFCCATRTGATITAALVACAVCAHHYAT